MTKPNPVVFGLPEWSLGGPTVFVERLARGLTGGGREARVLITERDTERVRERFAPIGIPDDLEVDLLPCGPADAWSARWEALIRYLEERAPCTYVMVHDWRNNVVAPRLSNRIRLIGVVQADTEMELEQAVRLGHLWDAIVAVADVIHFGLAQRAPHLAPRLVTIPNAAPLRSADVRTDSDTLRIVYCGRLSIAQKRVFDLLAIAKTLEARGVEFELTLIGDGPEREELEAAARPLIDRGRIRFTGLLANAEVLSELARHDVFLLVSEFEGMSIALLEAMSQGCVPLVTDIACNAELVQNGVTGYRVPIGDVEGFADRVAALATDAPARHRMSAAAVATIVDGGHDTETMIARWAQLLDTVQRRASSGDFVRMRGAMSPPPQRVDGIGVLLGDQSHETGVVNRQALWPDAYRPRRAPRLIRRATPPADWEPLALEGHRVLVAAPSGQISGVDVFSSHLVRQLRRRGFDAALLGQRKLEGPLGLELAEDLPVEGPPPSIGVPWRHRWRAMAAYLAGQGPCVYLPNYDYDHSGVSAILPDAVKVVPIAHSDDPVHYEHVMRLGDVSNAVVGVSEAIVDHIAGLGPPWLSHLHMIPYGVSVDPHPPPKRPDGPLRIVYCGRLVEEQKRVGDLIRIAAILAQRGVPFELTIIGDGPCRGELERESQALVLDRRVRFLGSLANEGVIQVLRESDVFLSVSAFEGLSVGMLEAMANHAVPLVSATRSGTAQVIDSGRNGLIAPVGDTIAFADHLGRLADDPPWRGSLAAAAFRTIVDQELTIDAMVDRYVELFRAVVERAFVRVPGALLVPAHLQGELDALRQVRRIVSKPRRMLRYWGPRLIR